MKKFLFVFSVLIFVSCFLDPRKKSSLGSSLIIEMTWPRVEVNQVIKTQMHPSTYEIRVILTGVENGRIHEGVLIRDYSKESEKLLLEGVIEGKYIIEVEAYDIGVKLIAKIEDEIYIYKDRDNTYSGIFGKPDNFDETKVFPTDGDLVSILLDLSWEIVTSNYVNSDTELDSITYSIYLGTEIPLSEKDKLPLDVSNYISGGIIHIGQEELNSIGIYLEQDKKYYWMVEAYNCEGSVCSEVHWFVYNNSVAMLIDFVSPIYPRDGDTIDLSSANNDLVFYSIYSEDNDGQVDYDNINYQIVISTDKDFEGGVEKYLYGSSSGSSTVTIDTSSLTEYFEEGRSYYWRIKGSNGYDSVYSPVWSFSINNNYIKSLAEFEVLPISPVDTEDIIDLLTLEFTALRLVDGGIDQVEYIVKLSESIDFAGDVYTLGAVVSDDRTIVAIDASSIKDMLKAGSRYYWKVEGKNDFGSIYSPIWSFSYRQGVALEEFNPLPNYPIDGSNIGNLDRFAFESIVSIDGSITETFYTIYLCPNIDFGISDTITFVNKSNMDGIEVVTSTFDANGNPIRLVNGQKYYWKVEAQNGYDSKTSPIWTFGYKSRK